MTYTTLARFLFYINRKRDVVLLSIICIGYTIILTYTQINLRKMTPALHHILLLAAACRHISALPPPITQMDHCHSTLSQNHGSALSPTILQPWFNLNTHPLYYPEASYRASSCVFISSFQNQNKKNKNKFLTYYLRLACAILPKYCKINGVTWF